MEVHPPTKGKPRGLVPSASRLAISGRTAFSLSVPECSSLWSVSGATSLSSVTKTKKRVFLSVCLHLIFFFLLPADDPWLNQ